MNDLEIVTFPSMRSEANRCHHIFLRKGNGGNLKKDLVKGQE